MNLRDQARRIAVVILHIRFLNWPPMPERRFPPTWSVEEQEACFVVRDHNGQVLAYVYFEEEPGRRTAAKLLTRDGGAKDRREYRQAAGVGAQVSAQPVPVSIDHDLVVIIQRSKWSLRARHHRHWWLIARTSKRTGGGRFSAADPPCSDTNQDQGSNGSDEQGDLTHVNSPLHSNHPTPTRTQLNSIRIFGVCPRSQIDLLRENAFGQCIAVNIAKLPGLAGQPAS